MSSWGCPHDLNGICLRVNRMRCDPGMKGCVLFGRFIWADESKNRPAQSRRGESQAPMAGNCDRSKGDPQAEN